MFDPIWEWDIVVRLPILAKITIGYFLFGMLFLLVLELATKRLSRRWDVLIAAVMEAGFSAGIPMSRMWAVSVLFGALFLFWPAVIVGMMQDVAQDLNGKANGDADKKAETTSGLNGTIGAENKKGGEQGKK